MALTNVIDGQRIPDGHHTALPVRHGAMKKVLVVAAIDFGTTYSGYAFQTLNDFTNNPLKIEANNWSQQGAVHGVSMKTPSSILFDKHQQFQSFGHDAESDYNKLAADAKHWDWYFFRRFKMALYKNKELSRGTSLTDESGGKTMPALTVFTACIKYLKDHLLKQNKAKKTGIKDEEIHWVLTVPAIWSDAAKQFMREAAIDAEIHTDKLSLSLEPEAASLFCRYLPVNKVSISGGSSIQSFGVGDKYMILDVGGGTVDITVHEVLRDDDTGDISLRELFCANGGEWGGLKVDDAFIDFLNDVIGPDVIEVVQTRYREDYMDLMARFEIKKRHVQPSSDTVETLSLPVSIATTYEEMNSETLENNSKIPRKYAGKIKFSKDKVRLDADVLKGFFDETCDQICDIASEYFGQIRDHNIDKILMVGGFSESQILQDKVRKKFPNKRLIIPEDAGLAVLKGAVLYGHNPSMITARVCKYTYGICAFKHYEPALDPKEKRVVKDKIPLCKDHFSVHATVGQEFKPGDTVGEQKYVPSDDDTTTMQIDVYTSPRHHPRYVDDETSSKIGQLLVPVDRKDESILVQFVFGDTELGVVAKDESGNTKKDAKFNFL